MVGAGQGVFVKTVVCVRVFSIFFLFFFPLSPITYCIQQSVAALLACSSVFFSLFFR
ncbi:hypothetical protein DFJ73DRAFT_849931 [Zopfochytrium polystomum]|nr:hypothetical protein DFJ73DRAFT_849931 [Zopfochytrium polystomum]